MSEVIRVFVGCAPDGLDAESQSVVEHSIRSRTAETVETTWMRLSKDPESPWYSDEGRGWNTERWATPFSRFRWAIPEVCGFEGRAIYCDSDVVFRADIAELWRTPMAAGKAIVAKAPNRLCVSLWDCAEAKKHLAPLSQMRRTGAGISKNQMLVICQPFAADQNWNCLDGEGLPLDHPSIKCIHFTDIATQQLGRTYERLAAEGRKHWFDGKLVQHSRPDLIALFEREFLAAQAAGYSVDQYDQSPRFGYVHKRDLSHYKGGPRLGAPPG